MAKPKKYQILDDLYEKANKALGRNANAKNMLDFINRKGGKEIGEVTVQDLNNYLERYRRKTLGNRYSPTANLVDSTKGGNRYVPKRGEGFIHNIDRLGPMELFFDNVEFSKDGFSDYYTFVDKQGTPYNITGEIRDNVIKNKTGNSINVDQAKKYKSSMDDLYEHMFYMTKENLSAEEQIKYFKENIEPLYKDIQQQQKKIGGKKFTNNQYNQRTIDDYNRQAKKMKLYERNLDIDMDTDTNKSTSSNTNTNANTDSKINRNLEAGDTVDINTGDIKKADGTIIKKDGTVIRPNTGTSTNTGQQTRVSPDDYFKNLNGSPEDIFNNFDNHFNQYLYDNPGLSGPEQMKAYEDLKKRYSQEADNSRQERVRREREQARQQEIEQYRREGKYDNGQVKVSEEVLDDGRHAKFYHNEDGSVHKQVITSENGDKDISFRRTEAEIGDDIAARKQISKKRVIKEGNKISIYETPNSMYGSEKVIDLDNKTVTINEYVRNHPWSGGKQAETTKTMSLDEYYNQRKKELFPDRNQNLNNKFRGGNPNNRTAQQKFVDNVIGKQNPGDKTSKVFNYKGKEYAVYDNLEVNSKDLSKGITRGRVVDLETNELIEAREAFPEINQALMDGDVDTALKELQSFEESKHTFAKSELDEKIVNKHTDHANQQNANHQETKKEQQNKNQQQHAEQQEDFDNARTEHNQETKDNHKENHQKSTDTPEGDTKKPRTRANQGDVDIDIDTDKKVRTRKQKLERTKGKKLVPGKTKVKSKLRVSKNVKGKDLNQILVNTFVNKALDTVDDALENTVHINTNTSNNHWSRTDFIHPDQMDDIQIADLTDQEIKMFANGDDAKIEEWTQRRNKAQANKVLDSYMENSRPNYTNSEQKNPYQYDIPETDFVVDENGNVKINKTGKTKTVEIEENKSYKRKRVEKMDKIINGGGSGNTLDDVMDWMKNHKLGILDIGMNVYGTISTYKDSRRKGRGVISSAARAAANFALFELLGPLGSFGVMAARTLPSLAIKGVDLLYKENRKMNSAANNQLFGNVQFQDTQQLATMRQSGMEMAKMAQYNLQQTLMGTEATYLHR